jgi:hypothetical protein
MNVDILAFSRHIYHLCAVICTARYYESFEIEGGGGYDHDMAWHRMYDLSVRYIYLARYRRSQF